MVENQLTQIADMAKHGITITSQLFGTVASDITNLNQIVKTGQSLSYTMSNLDSSFRLRFPGYSSSTNYGQSYQTWSQTSLDSTLGALNAAGYKTHNSTVTKHCCKLCKVRANRPWAECRLSRWGTRLRRISLSN